MKYLTWKMLEPLEPCKRQERLFKRTFKSGRVALTGSNARRHGEKFDAHWLAENLLNSDGYEKFNDAVSRNNTAVYNALEIIWATLSQKRQRSVLREFSAAERIATMVLFVELYHRFPANID